MATCQKCGVTVSEQDLYEDQGQKVCEDCKLKTAPSPSKPCGGEQPRMSSFDAYKAGQ